ncbi:MAG: glycosyltransferase [Candidatus Eisenbacteria bacterium]
MGTGLNILLLANSFHTGGFEQLTLEIIRSLHPGGIRFRVCCLKEEGTLAPEVRKAGVRIDGGFLRGTYDLAAVFRLTRALQGERYDLLFVEPGRNALLAGEWIARSLRIRKRISAIHATRQWGRKRMFRWSQLRLLKGLDGVILVAPTQKDYLVREEGLDPANLAVILNGVDHRAFRPRNRDELPPLLDGPRPGEKAVGIVASLTPEKGHGVFLEAAAAARKEVPEARFYVVGEGPERPAIERKIAELGLEGAVRLTGRRRDLPAFLPRLDLLALSSHPYRETLPISTMEGMACGIPTVNTDVGSIRDLVVDGETGLLVPPGDPREMARAFARILRDLDLARRMGAAGRRRIEELFTLERTIEDYRRYFLEIAGGTTV